MDTIAGQRPTRTVSEMIDKHIRDEFEAIPEVNERLKWLIGKLESGVLNSCTALQLAWDDGARATLGDKIIVVTVVNRSMVNVGEILAGHLETYEAGVKAAADSMYLSSDVYVYPDDEEEFPPVLRTRILEAIARFMHEAKAEKTDD